MSFRGSYFMALLFSSQGLNLPPQVNILLSLPFCTFLPSQPLSGTHLTLQGQFITKLWAHLFSASIPGTKEKPVHLKPLIFPGLLTHLTDVLQCQSQVGPSITRVIPKQLQLVGEFLFFFFKWYDPGFLDFSFHLYPFPYVPQ